MLLISTLTCLLILCQFDAPASSSPVNITDVEKRWHSISKDSPTPFKGGQFFLHWPVRDGIATVNYCYATSDDYEKLQPYFALGVNLWQAAGPGGVIKVSPDTGDETVFCSDKDDQGSFKNSESALCISYTGSQGVTQALTGFSDAPGQCHNVMRIGYDENAIKSTGEDRDSEIEFVIGAVAHELGHVFGLLHEHQRPDRDKFITFNCQNLRDYERVSQELVGGDTMEDACTGWDAAAKYGFSAIDYVAFPPRFYPSACSNDYDERSIMHYPSFAGGWRSNDDGKAVLLLNGKGGAGQSGRQIIQSKPSSKDNARVWQMYRQPSGPAPPQYYQGKGYVGTDPGCDSPPPKPPKPPTLKGKPPKPPKPPTLKGKPSKPQKPTHMKGNPRGNGTAKARGLNTRARLSS